MRPLRRPKGLSGALKDSAPTALADLMPPAHQHLADDNAFRDRLRACVHPTFYAAQRTRTQRHEVAKLGVDAALDDFLAVGAREGARVCALFNPDWYAEQLGRTGRSIPAEQVPFFHWLTIGWEQRIVPTPLFDAEAYLENHPQLRHHPRWLFHHYLVRGCYHYAWIPSPAGQHHAGGRDDRAQALQAPLMLPDMLHRAHDFDLRRTSWLEEGVCAVLDKRQRVESGVMRAMVDRAAELEPLIHRPRRRSLSTTWPLHRHPRLRAAQEVEAAREAVGEQSFDTIILLPHCRIGGAARVAGLFTQAVAAAAGSDRVLIVTTDLPAFERPDWYPAQVPILDLTPWTHGMSLTQRRLVLLDLVRGLAPRRLVTINSSLGWDLLLAHGEQLASRTELGAYLFTWDVDGEGHKGGYPIFHFQRCLEHLSWVLFDSNRLRCELIARYVMPPELQNRLVLARTPVADTGVDVTGVFADRRARGAPLRAFWAGRFDRQKRFDLVVAVARQLPQLELLAWGKPVLGDVEVDMKDLPSNVRLMGTYAHFDEIPLSELDFMLYTSAWDGIPTVVLDAAQRGVPIVASAVGGVPEVVFDATGYPVASVDDPAAYVAAIKEMVEDPQAATERTEHMREVVQRRFDPAGYQRIVEQLLRESRGEV